MKRPRQLASTSGRVKTRSHKGRRTVSNLIPFSQQRSARIFEMETKKPRPISKIGRGFGWSSSFPELFNRRGLPLNSYTVVLNQNTSDVSISKVRNRLSGSQKNSFLFLVGQPYLRTPFLAGVEVNHRHT